VNSLLERLSQTCFLKRLSIPKARLNEYAVDLLSSIIEGSTAPNLIELDVSWNELNNYSMLKILKSLAINKRLSYLNLSYNEIREDTDIKPLL
jgi:Ran GTPase-activating protein (RanGAP) involved in mRNA processing and transport